MPVKLPIEIVYYFEISPVGDRLLYCIPSAILRAMKKKKEINESIVKDYPDGVDVKVTSEALEKFNDTYGLQLNIDPSSLNRAFQFLKYKSGKEFPKTGFIERKFLEDLSKKLESELKERKISLIPDSKKLGVDKLSIKKTLLKNQRDTERKVKSEFHKIKFKPLDEKIPIIGQDFLKVKMSKGEKAFDFFSKMQQQTERRK